MLDAAPSTKVPGVDEPRAGRARNWEMTVYSRCVEFLSVCARKEIGFSRDLMIRIQMIIHGSLFFLFDSGMTPMLLIRCIPFSKLTTKCIIIGTSLWYRAATNINQLLKEHHHVEPDKVSGVSQLLHPSTNLARNTTLRTSTGKKKAYFGRTHS